MSYVEEQRASGIKVGDRVRVKRIANNNENGWGYSWVNRMDYTVGKVYTVCDIGNENKGFGLNNSDIDGDPKSDPTEHGRCFWYYPWFVLEKLDPETKVKKLDIVVNGKTLKVSEAIAKRVIK